VPRGKARRRELKGLEGEHISHFSFLQINKKNEKLRLRKHPKTRVKGEKD